MEPEISDKEIPDDVTDDIGLGSICCSVAYSYDGTYVACGLVDGTLALMDSLTKEVLWQRREHVMGIDILAWSKDTYWLMTAARDWWIILWNVATGKPEHKVNFGRAVFYANINPRDPLKYVAIGLDFKLVTGQFDNGKKKSLIDGQRIYTACFLSNGALLTGDSKGALRIFDDNLEVICRKKISSSGIKSIVQPLQNDDSVVLNVGEDVILVVNLPDLKSSPETWIFEPVVKFYDTVGFTKWGRIACSGNGKYTLATSRNDASCLYLWSMMTGTIVRKYTFEEVNMLALAFHPMLPEFLSTALDEDSLFVWEVDFPQGWAALQPGFRAMVEVEEYEEREDEFDVEIDDNRREAKPVDVWTCEFGMPLEIIPVRCVPEAPTALPVS